MSDATKWIGGLGRSARLGLALGALLIVAAVAALGWWALRAPKAVLFGALAERDAALIAGELDRLKQTYEFAADGQTILVPADAVHKTRIALMGRPLPLHGAVGFELFNHAEFGASDFVQKINFQRALQGELTRTIASIEQVADARVHLALPEATLFRKDAPKAKASVTVTMKPGQALAPTQVHGIQRLVAASVPEVRFDDVTVLNQQGVVLSRAGGDGAQADARLDARQAIEQHLARKATQLLERMFGPGTSTVAVDVVLNHQQTRVTTEEVLGAAPSQPGQPAAGVVVRERSTSREAPGDGGGAPAAALSTQELDYQTGRRVEQVVSDGAQVARINVAVVVKRTLSEAEAGRLRQLLSAAVGLQPARGDLIAVQSAVDADGSDGREVLGWSAVAPAAPDYTRALVATPPAAAPAAAAQWLGWLALPALAVALAIGVIVRRRRDAAPPAAVPALSDDERAALLRTMRQWLRADGGRG